MNRNALISVVLAVLLVTSSFVGFAASQSVTQIDDNHSLTTDEKYQQFKDDGSATAEVSIPETEITVSKSCEFESCGVVFPTDSANEFVHIDYKEDLDRNLRIYLPSKYIGVVTAERKSIDGDTTAHFSPTVKEGKLYLVMKVEFSEKQKATFSIGEAESMFNGQLIQKRKAVESISGVSMSSDNWQYIDSNSINDASYLIGTQEKSDSVIVEYKETSQVKKNGETVTETQWTRAPHEQTDSDPVYIQQRGQEYYIITQSGDHPQIRYKNQPTSWDRLFGSVDEISDFVTDGIWEIF